MLFNVFLYETDFYLVFVVSGGSTPLQVDPPLVGSLGRPSLRKKKKTLLHVSESGGWSREDQRLNRRCWENFEIKQIHRLQHINDPKLHPTSFHYSTHPIALHAWFHENHHTSINHHIQEPYVIRTTIVFEILSSIIIYIFTRVWSAHQVLIFMFLYIDIRFSWLVLYILDVLLYN